MINFVKSLSFYLKQTLFACNDAETTILQMFCCHLYESLSLFQQRRDAFWQTSEHWHTRNTSLRKHRRFFATNAGKPDLFWAVVLEKQRMPLFGAEFEVYARFGQRSGAKQLYIGFNLSRITLSFSLKSKVKSLQLCSVIIFEVMPVEMNFQDIHTGLCHCVTTV